jgi:predicted dehydrogenase
MTEPRPAPSRRSFLHASAALSAASALNGWSVPLVHAGQDSTIRLALIGCGGRGTGAVGDAFSTADQGPVQLVAMADVFEDRLAQSYDYLSKEHSDKLAVPPEQKFLGFDAYKHAMDCLQPGDVAILTTPPAFRWVMFTYAIEKGLNVFMEKAVTVDGPTSRRMLALADKASEKNLKVGVGLMCRHCAARHELLARIRENALGDLITFRSYRQGGPAGMIGPKPDDISELLYQVRNFHGFFWGSGGVFVDYMIHNIDECCWFKGAWPVKAQGSGGRVYREDKVDQNFDNYSIEYVFADGTRLFTSTRFIPGCRQEFASYIHGSKASAVLSTSMHTPARCRIYKGQDVANPADLAWAFPQPEPNPYQLEWRDLVDAIRHDKPYNEARRGVEASLVAAMGRMAVHTGQDITFDDMLNSEQEFAPDIDKLTYDSPAPVQLAASGIYPTPQPGMLKDREY